MVPKASMLYFDTPDFKNSILFAYFPDIYNFGLYVSVGAVPIIDPSIYLLFLKAVEILDQFEYFEIDHI